jgi:uncharacterized membrane protein YfcA
LHANDVAVFVLSALTLFTAAGGGIGGGTLFVPLLTVIGGFATTNAVAMSNVTVFGGAVANLLLNLRRPYARSVRALPRTALLASGVTTPPPLIDWSLILMMEPSTLVGALAGGYVHELLPTWLLLTLLSGLLLFLAWQLTQKAAMTYAAETRQKRRERAAAWGRNQAAGAEQVEEGLDAPLLPPAPGGGRGGGTFDDTEDEEAAAAASKPNKTKKPSSSSSAAPLVIIAGDVSSTTDDVGRSSNGGDQDASVRGGGGGGGGAPSPAAAVETAAPRPATAASAAAAPDDADPAELLLKRPAAVPWLKVATIATLTAAMLLTDTAKAQLPCGSRGYVLASVAVVPLALAVVLAQRARLLARAASAAEAHDLLDAAQRSLSSTTATTPPSTPDLWSPSAVRAALGSHVRWTPRTSLLYPLLSTLAGVCASMFGIGGGVVKGPLMLALGVCPEVAAATSSTMIFFTSAGASAFYINANYVTRPDYALALFGTAFVCTAAGQVCSQKLVKALGRRSVIVFAMAAMMVAAALVAVVQSAFATRAAVAQHRLWDWGSICGATA